MIRLPDKIRPDVIKEKTQRVHVTKTNSGKNKGRKIQKVLVGAFLVPVFFIIILGIVSYQKASKTIVDKYKESSISAISAESLYFNLLCETVAGKANEIIIDDNASAYYEKYYKNSKANDSFRELRQNLIYTAGSTNYI